MDGVERTQILLTEDQARRLRTLARRRGMSMVALIRDAVERAYPRPGHGDERWSNAPAAAGGFRSGVSDVGAEQDRELGDAIEG